MHSQEHSACLRLATSGEDGPSQLENILRPMDQFIRADSDNQDDVNGAKKVWTAVLRPCAMR